jgi:co-chaperonin GroES (HSP10)|uniref:Co-chaperonin GroES n=1 Tax=uncultured virus TaxID=340016 RepID=A0A221S3N2_9VIRU|nr:co-chaperonin GroES [uncultured virus]|tara:strand:+ start:7 stop:477 length:471 start_codon:yes stop_codon:yes gene_type:complete
MTKNSEVSKTEIPNRTEALLDNYKSKDKIEETRLDAKSVESNKDLLDRLPSPTGYRLLVLPYAGPKKTKGGLYLADTTQDTIQMTTVCAYVLKVGDQAYKDESKFPNGPWCEKGDWIIFGRYAGSRFKIEGGEVRILNDDEIIAKINNPEDILHAY